MINVAFPPPQFRMKTKEGKPYIFDAIRKTWLLLTEEEWVRQNMVAYLTVVLAYPKEALALEKEIRVNGLKKRFDILVYGRDHQPWMLLECKAPQVSLSETVLQQALRYHIVVPASFIVLTNGLHTLAWQKEAGQLHPLERLPLW